MTYPEAGYQAVGSDSKQLHIFSSTYGFQLQQCGLAELRPEANLRDSGGKAVSCAAADACQTTVAVEI